MNKNLPKSKGIYIERSLLRSPAYWDLNGTAIRILNIFYLKRQIKKIKSHKRKNENIVNNGDIIFTYVEAEKKYGISKNTFFRARNKLIEVGFIKISEPGGNHIGTTYFISQRWQKYPEESWPINKAKTLVGKKTRFVKKHPQK